MMRLPKAPLAKFVCINPGSITKGYPHDTIEYIEISSVASGYLTDSPKEIPLKEAPSRAKRIVKDGDIILAMVRPNLRSFLLIRDPKPNTVVSTGFAVLRAKERVDCRYVYYAITDRVFTQYLTNNTKGTSYPAVDADIVLRGEIPDITYDQQIRIADILSAYDDLIENNKRRIALLEQAARLLYREWFVHFRFPGHEHVKIVDGVPEGWNKKTLSEVADIIMGQSPKSEYYNEDGIGLPFHQGASNFGTRFPVNKTYCTVEARIAEPGDILFSVRAPVGRINITSNKIVIGRGIAAIRSKQGQQSFLFYQLKNYFFKENMIGSGAIFAAITKSDLQDLTLLSPSPQLVKAFQEYVCPIDRQIELLHKDSQKLREARDLLLPRVMKGEIAI